MDKPLNIDFLYEKSLREAKTRKINKFFSKNKLLITKYSDRYDRMADNPTFEGALAGINLFLDCLTVLEIETVDLDMDITRLSPLVSQAIQMKVDIMRHQANQLFLSPPEIEKTLVKYTYLYHNLRRVIIYTIEGTLVWTGKPETKPILTTLE